MNEAEQEAIILNSAWEMIDEMVNWAMFVKRDPSNATHLAFHGEQHGRLFTILLGDFLSEIRAFRGDPLPLGLTSPPSDTRPSDLTFLFHLRRICRAPSLGSDTAELNSAVEEFATWLEREFTASGVNLSAIGVPTADLNLSRLRYLKMCGDIGKHSLPRLSGNVRHLRRLLEAAGHAVGEQEGYLAINDFYQWFQQHIFLYHATQIAEFLNNIRWAIYSYLQPEFQRAWYLPENATPTFRAYSYHVPPAIEEPVAIAMYWNIMNHVRSRPYFPRFETDPYLKRQF